MFEFGVLIELLFLKLQIQKIDDFNNLVRVVE